MKRWLWVVCCSVSLWTSLAMAQAPEVTAGVRPETSRFSVGAGLGFASDGLGGLGLLGGGNLVGLALTRGNVPFGTAMVEAALSPRLRLGLGASGSYTKNRYRDGDPTLSASIPREAGFASGSLSLRWILNPEGVVQISPMISAGASWSTSQKLPTGSVPATDTSPAMQLLTDSEAYAIDGRLALVLEYRLLPQLFLRFESYFARAGYGHTADSTKRGAETARTRLSQTSLNFGWLPALQLRMTF